MKYANTSYEEIKRDVLYTLCAQKVTCRNINDQPTQACFVNSHLNVCLPDHTQFLFIGPRESEIIQKSALVLVEGNHTCGVYRVNSKSLLGKMTQTGTVKSFNKMDGHHKMVVHRNGDWVASMASDLNCRKEEGTLVYKNNTRKGDCGTWLECNGVVALHEGTYGSGNGNIGWLFKAQWLGDGITPDESRKQLATFLQGN